VMELYKYATTYFKADKKLMKTQSYPQFGQTYLSAIDFVPEIDSQYVTASKASEAVRMAQESLINWFIEHIQKQDMDFAKFIHGSPKSVLDTCCE